MDRADFAFIAVATLVYWLLVASGILPDLLKLL